MSCSNVVDEEGGEEEEAESPCRNLRVEQSSDAKAVLMARLAKEAANKDIGPVVTETMLRLRFDSERLRYRSQK